jgi:hypothetical protein
MISDGHDPEGVDLTQTRHLGFPGMSASGSDVFFTTHTRLVAQDGDELGDLYDARIGGGFPRPRAAVSCLGEGERETSCQQESQEQRELGAGVFGALGSFVFAGANLGSPAPASPASANGSPKLRIALGKLERDGLQVTVKTSAKGTVTITGRGLKPTSRSVADGAHLLRVPLTAAGRALERVRATTRLKATLKVGTATVSATVAVRL